jgi:hypothetical protein
MFASVRNRLLTALVLLAGACGVGSEPTRAGSGDAGSLFEPRPSDWRPLSTNMLNFYHVEEGGDAGGASHLANIDKAVFQQMYGNFVLSNMDYRVAGLVADESFRPLVITSPGKIVDTLDAFKASIATSQQWLGTPQDYSGGEGHIFLFPRPQDLERFASLAKTRGIDGLTPPKQLAPNCLYSRLVHPKTRSEAAVLLAATPDRVLSLKDAADRACLEAFFLENMGVRRQAAPLLLPVPGAEADCVIARIRTPADSVAAGAPNSLGCPEAPNRRAVMLLNYLQRLGRQGDLKAGALAARVRKSCAELMEAGNNEDLSCAEIARGDD